MAAILILFVGILFWIIEFKISKEKIFMKVMSASLISLTVVTLGSARFNYISWDTYFVLNITCLVIYVIIDLIYKRKIKRSNKQ